MDVSILSMVISGNYFNWRYLILYHLQLIYPLKYGDFPVRYVKLPEGKSWLIHSIPISGTD